ncbi:MAG TPA: hypothetical protein VL171_01140 [Verrucomicrobiae bacterium]|nr:hypothetical protein [Verrucomicrobiae bacterium]
MKTFRATVLLFVFAVAASCAQETNTLPTTITVDGITYSNVTWRGVTPATVSIIHKTGVASLPLEKLPPELQKRFGYDQKKAADYMAAERRAEAARLEARSKQWDAEAAERQRQAQQDAEKQKLVADAAAKQAAEDAAAKQADEAAAKKAAQDFQASLGPVTLIKFSRATTAKLLPDGRYEANLYYNDDLGVEQQMYVTFPPTGFDYMKNARRFFAPNSWTVYGRPYTANLQNGFGAQFTETGYYLVGMRQQLSGGNTYPAW